MSQPDSNKTYGFKDMPQIRPAEIKTYHSAKGKTLLITAGGMFPLTVQ
jgi:hypothetical protein